MIFIRTRFSWTVSIRWRWVGEGFLICTSDECLIVDQSANQSVLLNLQTVASVPQILAFLLSISFPPSRTEVFFRLSSCLAVHLSAFLLMYYLPDDLTVRLFGDLSVCFDPFETIFLYKYNSRPRFSSSLPTSG